MMEPYFEATRRFRRVTTVALGYATPNDRYEFIKASGEVAVASFYRLRFEDAGTSMTIISPETVPNAWGDRLRSGIGCFLMRVGPFTHLPLPASRDNAAKEEVINQVGCQTGKFARHRPRICCSMTTMSSTAHLMIGFWAFGAKVSKESRASFSIDTERERDDDA